MNVRFCFRRFRSFWPGCALSFALAANVGAADDLAVLSDEFDDPGTIGNFQRVYQVEGSTANQLQTFDINTSRPGSLVMVPYASTWYQNFRGELAFKTVTGDFVFTTEVEANRRNGSGPPQSTYSLGGLMVRAPRPGVTNAASWTPGAENYVFLSLGAAGMPGVYQFEVKTTSNSLSTLVSAPATNRAIIQVARLGSALIMLRRQEGGPWVIHRRYSRADLPATVQAGLTTYTDWPTASQYPPAVHNQIVITNGHPDLVASFEYLRYQRPVIPPALAGLDFSSPSQVPDAALLSFLGANANAPAPLQPPSITLHPQSQNIPAGGSVIFTVAADGHRPFHFQWQKNSVDLPGAESDRLVLANVQPGDAGTYTVIVTNRAGTATSFSAYLAVHSGPAYLPAGTNSPAVFTIGTYVVATNPPRFGLNLREPSEQNNFTGDPGFEPITIRRQHTATGGGANYILNNAGATTSHYRTMADGFFDGATVRVYRPSTNGGALQFVRSNTVVNYITDGFRRLNPLPIRSSQFTDDAVVAGVTYEYQVRAVNSSAVVSTNFDGPIIVFAVPLPGSTTAQNSVWTNSFFGRNGQPPAVPANVQATALPGAVLLDWNDNAEGDLAGYYIYRRSVPADGLYRIILDSDGPPVLPGDIYFLEMFRDNPPVERVHDRLNAISLNDPWRFTGGANWPYGLNGSARRDSTTVCPENGGRSSLRIETAGSHEVSIRQPRFSAPQFYAGFYPALVAGRHYRVDVWLKQTGVPSGRVTFRLTQHYSGVQQSWTVGNDWQKFTYLFTAPPLPTNGAIAEVVLAFNGPGTVWADNLLLYEDADGDPATYPAFALRPAARQALLDYAPSVIRIWTGVDTEYWGVSVDDWTRAEPEVGLHWEANTGRRVPDDPYQLPTALRICQETGADPWLIVGSFMTEREWGDLLEYLAAPYDPAIDSPATKPYAYRRVSQGQAAPWTDLFPRLFLEYGNELWNGSFQWNFGVGNTAGQFSEHFFAAARSSPWYQAVSNKIDLIVNGWLVSAERNSGYGHAASLAAPSAAYNDIAVYIGGWEAGINVGGATVNDQGFQDYLLYAPSFIRYYVDQQTASRDANRAAGFDYNIAVYEGGPGYANPSPGQPFEPVSETYGKSLSAAVATLDTYLYNSRHGIDPQAYFSFGPGYNWSSHATIDRGYFPHANWLALQMRNRFASGSMVATAIHGAPTTDIPVRTNAQGQIQVPSFPNTPLVVPYAFRDGDRFSVFVLSRSVSNATPVTLRLPFNAAGRITLHRLTGDPRAGNSTNFLIVPTAEQISNFSENFEFTLPPGSIYLYVFEGISGLVESNVTATISQALGQSDPTTYPQAVFDLFFSQPVTGLTSDDVQVSGTAGANRVSLVESAPFNGSSYQLAVSGMTGPGSVIVNVPAGAAVGANGSPSLAASIIDNQIDYTVRAPQNRLLAWDDFAVTPTNVFHPAQGLNSGSGWSGPWQAQNYVPATYTNGYRLGGSAPLEFGALSTAGGYLLGGRGYEYSYRGLNVDGAFANFRQFNATPSRVGLDGTTLWMSALLRKETDDFAPVNVVLVNADGLQAYGQINIGAGYYGQVSTLNNVRYWTLAVGNATNGTDYIRSDVPVVIGQAALLVLRIQFGPTDTLSLYVNPSALGDGPPALANAAATVSNADISFRSVRFYAGLGGGLFSGDAFNKGSFDEIRFGDTYAAVTPRPGPPPAAPSITSQPESMTLASGGWGTLRVEAEGTAPIGLQWLKDGVLIPSATNARLELGNVSRADAGSYSVVLSNAAGTVRSNNAVLRVLVPQFLRAPRIEDDQRVRVYFGDSTGGPADGAVAGGFEVWAASSLSPGDWSLLPISVRWSNGLFFFEDPEAGRFPQRFYRVIER